MEGKPYAEDLAFKTSLLPKLEEIKNNIKKLPVHGVTDKNV